MIRAFTDWPAAGEIDLELHDLPHRSSTTEWWYVNTHLALAGGKQVSLFAAFFRVRSATDASGQPVYAHSATWALSDPEGKAYHADSRVDQNAPRLGLEQIKNGHGARDARLNRAMSEVLQRGAIPTPDRLFDGAVEVGTKTLSLDFGGLKFEKRDGGTYHLTLQSSHNGAGCELSFKPLKPATRHGDDGVVQGPGGEQMFYYLIPRCEVTGSVRLQGNLTEVTSGTGWYDHEFGGHPPRPEGTLPSAADAAGHFSLKRDVGWNWVALQLDDGSELSAYSLVNAEDGKVLHQWAVHIDAAGRREGTHEVTFAPLNNWRSVRTFAEYPTRWQLTVPAFGLSLSLDAAFDDQELMTVISKPAFWEGRCQVRGERDGKQVSGLAYIERSGFSPLEDLDSFFCAVGTHVRSVMTDLVPFEPGPERAQQLFASKERAHYLDGADLHQLSEALVKPIREITDRGGKSWRSYAALACVDVVGGDSRKFAHWLPMPELLHVGSLIVDDVQDKSTVRRGGPSCHLVYGEPLAINAGTAAYFLTQELLINAPLTDAVKLRLYDLYFEAMRAGHAGQALDLSGLDSVMPEVVATGEARGLEKRILATHRLKTAAPAATLARMGATAGGGTHEQIEAVGHFFESLGLAFQIVDDVLNLRGFKGGLKKKAEDLTNGVVTLPVAKAMSRLPHKDRASLWATLQARTSDEQVLAGAVELLESCGAIKACADEANELVESAWAKAAPLLPDSLYKVVLRAFGWYVLERHY